MKWLRLWIDILDDPKLADNVTDAETFTVKVSSGEKDTPEGDQMGVTILPAV